MGKISFFFKEAFGSLRRNFFMTIAALVTVFLSLLVLGESWSSSSRPTP